MKQVTVHTYRQDTYYPRVVRAVATILARSDVVAPVDVLLEMGNLTPQNYEAWYRGHVPSLERVFAGSLSKANRILRLIGFHVHDLDMVPRRTVYYQPMVLVSSKPTYYISILQTKFSHREGHEA